MLEENICRVCKAEFRSGHLDEDKKCVQCEKLWPGVKNKSELKRDEGEIVKANELKITMQEEIAIALAELGITHKCDCGESFYKRSPAQKNCGKCKGDKE